MPILQSYVKLGLPVAGDSKNPPILSRVLRPRIVIKIWPRLFSVAQIKLLYSSQFLNDGT